MSDEALGEIERKLSGSHHSDLLFAREDVEAVIAQLRDARAENERLKRGGAQLGTIIDRHCRWVVDATNSQDLISEDGDGDWDVVWERLFGLARERDELRAKVQRVETLCEWHETDAKVYNAINWRNSEVAGRIRAALAGGEQK